MNETEKQSGNIFRDAVALWRMGNLRDSSEKGLYTLKFHDGEERNFLQSAQEVIRRETSRFFDEFELKPS